MTTTGKKEYTLKINGVDQNIKEVTKLLDVVTSLDAELGKNKSLSTQVAKVSKEHAKALSEEEKAEQKVINAIDKVVRARTDANKAQIEANLAVRETQREVMREIQLRQQAEGSIKQMGMQLTDLRNAYEGLSRAQREDEAVGGDLLRQIQALDAEYKALRESTGNFRDSVGNYEKALGGLGKLSDGIEGATKSSMGLAQSLLGANALMAMFGTQSDESAESALKLQKIIALLSIAQQVNENLLRAGIVQNKLAIVTDTIRTAQIKAKTAAEAASTKGTVAATIAQKAFNAVAKANPYMLLALALAGVGAALVTFVSGSKKAKEAQARLNAEIATTNRLLSQLNRDTELAAAIAEAEGKSEEEVLAIRRKAVREKIAIAQQNVDNAEKEKDATQEQKDELKKILQDAINEEKNLNDQATILDARRRRENADAEEAARKEVIQKAKEHAKEMADLAKEQADTELTEKRAAEDSKIALEQDAYTREKEQTKKEYTRQIEDLKKRLDEEKNLTDAARDSINEQILNLEKKKDQDLRKLDEDHNKEIKQKLADDLAARADLELNAIDSLYAEIEKKRSEATAREKGGLELIDVEATRKNLEDIDDSLSEYIARMLSYREQLAQAHEAALDTLEEGTPAYEAELQNYANMVGYINEQVKNAQDAQVKNSEEAAEVTGNYWADLFGKIADYAAKGVEALNSVMDTWNMGLQAQLDSLNEQLDAVNERYDEAKQRREEAAENVEKIEERMQNASGGTAEALKEQLQEATQARNEAAREEQRLAREKEKLEAQVAKKEKQMKRNELISNMSMAAANVAEAVTKAFTKGPIIGQIFAGIIAAMGAVQIGIMAKQLTKLEKGGEIKGPSHAAGGVPILINGEYTHEAQGGEFMINDKSYAANKALVNFINATPRPVTGADLYGLIPRDAAPIILSDSARSGEDRIIEAIEGIEIRPVVAVTDIIDASDDVTTVRDLADF